MHHGRIEMALTKCQSPSGAMLYAFLSSFLHAFLHTPVERRGHFHIEPAPNESEAEWFAGQFGELNANAAADALAGLENDAARLHELLEGTPLLPITARVHVVSLGVMLQRTVTGGSAITMQTARRLDGSFLGVKAGAGIAG